MIITIAGKPCCGKSTTAELFSKKFNFDRINTGAIFKDKAKEMGKNVLELCSSDDAIKIDYQVDNELKNIYNSRLNDDLIIESRTSWSFMPEALNVYLDVDDDVIASRLFNSDRTGKEKAESLEQAKVMAMSRYKADCDRYKKIYNIDCTNLHNYDFVLNNSNLTPDETADKIYEAYLEYLNKKLQK